MAVVGRQVLNIHDTIDSSLLWQRIYKLKATIPAVLFLRFSNTKYTPIDVFSLPTVSWPFSPHLPELKLSIIHQTIVPIPTPGPGNHHATSYLHDFAYSGHLI